MDKSDELFDLVTAIPPHMMSYFDFDSEARIDFKLDVLRRLSRGERLEEIEGWEKAFELLDSEQHWD